MPVLKNPRWERFAQLIVSYVAKPGEPNSKGKLYSQSGYNAKGVGQDGGSAEVNASRLLKYAQVKNRVQELLDQAAKDTKVTIESIKAEYDEAREHAKKLDQTSVMLAASQAKAKLFRLDTTVIETINSENNNNIQTSREMAMAWLLSYFGHRGLPQGPAPQMRHAARRLGRRRRRLRDRGRGRRCG